MDKIDDIKFCVFSYSIFHISLEAGIWFAKVAFFAFQLIVFKDPLVTSYIQTEKKTVWHQWLFQYIDK